MQRYAQAQRLFVVIACIAFAYTATCQQGTYSFRSTNGDSSISAEIFIGWDYIRATKIATLVGGVSFSEAYASTPNYNFSFGDNSYFWISSSSHSLKFLGEYSITKKRFVYIRINKDEYRE